MFPQRLAHQIVRYTLSRWILWVLAVLYTYFTCTGYACKMTAQTPRQCGTSGLNSLLVNYIGEYQNYFDIQSWWDKTRYWFKKTLYHCCRLTLLKGEKKSSTLVNDCNKMIVMHRSAFLGSNAMLWTSHLCFACLIIPSFCKRRIKVLLFEKCVKRFR